MNKLFVQRSLLAGLLLLASGLTGLAQSAGDSDYAVFVSQRAGVAELFTINLTTRQVSQLTNTGRGHLVPSSSFGTREVVFAAQEGSNFELFTAQVANSWRSRRPSLLGLQRLTVNTFDEVSPSISSAGTMVAFSSYEGLEVMTVNGGARQLVLANSGKFRDYSPAISPDGSQIAFISDRSGVEDIWLLKLASNEVRRLTYDAQPLGGLSWSANGELIAFTTANTKTKLTGIALADSKSGNYRVVTDSGDSSPALSARGNRMLFTSQRDGDPELYLFDFAKGIALRLTNSAGLDDGAVFLAEPALPTRQP